MAIWRSPEVETLLGGPLDAIGITAASIDRVVTDHARESEVLDFKQSLWPKSPKPRPPWTPEQEFAKDVGAFANHRGGVLLVGIAETAGAATSTTPFTLPTDPDSEERRLRQALVNNLAPPASCDFVWVEESGHWYCAVVVPSSPRSPHAVVIEGGTGLRYPVRHGSETTWLTESEVAERYRRRQASDADHVARVRSVTETGRSALATASGLWLFAAAIPESPVAGRLDAGTVREIDDWHRHGLVSPLGRGLPAYGRGIPAPGRVTFTGHSANRKRTRHSSETRTSSCTSMARPSLRPPPGSTRTGRALTPMSGRSPWSMTGSS